MSLEWKYVEALESESLIDQFEKEVEYKFPLSFREVVIKNNGGLPSKTVFDTEYDQCCMNYLLSFNMHDERFSIWDMRDAWESNIEVAKDYGVESGDYSEFKELKQIYDRYVVFANTPFGDDIAFDKENDSVVYIDHEILDVERIADSFEEFLDCLYEEDEDEDEE